MDVTIDDTKKPQGQVANRIEYFKGYSSVTAGNFGGFFGLFAPAALWFSACLANSWYRSATNCLEFSAHECTPEDFLVICKPLRMVCWMCGLVY